MIRAAVLAALLLAAAPVLAEAANEEPDGEGIPACSAWVAQMQEDEGGAVFTAGACATDRPDAFLTMTCAGGAVHLRYDLAAGAERSPRPGETAGVDFTIGISTQRVPMQHEAMDGMFAGVVPAAGPLVALLASGEELRVGDGAGVYPGHTFRLTGSSSAVAELLARCR